MDCTSRLLTRLIVPWRLAKSSDASCSREVVTKPRRFRGAVRPRYVLRQISLSLDSLLLEYMSTLEPSIVGGQHLGRSTGRVGRHLALCSLPGQLRHWHITIKEEIAKRVDSSRIHLALHDSLSESGPTANAHYPEIRMRFIEVAALIVALATGDTSAEGINCFGRNALCRKGDTHSFARKSIGISESRMYRNGEHIICDQILPMGTGVCVFLQHMPENRNRAGVPGKEIKRLLQALDSYGCDRCGSVPLGFPESNNWKITGELTVNYVRHVNGCTNICD